MTTRHDDPTAFLDQSLDIFPDLLFLVNAEGVILDYRGGGDTQLYVQPHAFLGRSLQAVLPASTATRLGEAVARVSHTQIPVAINYTLPMRDGERAFEARLVPMLPDAILAVCRDVSETPRPNERLQAERRVAESRRIDLGAGGVPQQNDQRFRRLAESIDQTLWLRDADAEHLLYVSPAFESLFGRQVDELYANPHLWIQTIHRDDRRRATARYDAWFSGRSTDPGSVTYRVVRPDGTIRWLRDTVTVFIEQPSLRRQVGGVVRDVTAQRDLAHAVNNALSDIMSATQVAFSATQVARWLAPDDPLLRDTLDRALAASLTADALVRGVHAMGQHEATEGGPTGFGSIINGGAGLVPENSPLLSHHSTTGT